MPYLQQATQELETKMAASQDENQQIMSKINAQRAEIDQLMAALTNAVGDLEKSIQSLSGDAENNPGTLRAEVWQMEQEAASTR